MSQFNSEIFPVSPADIKGFKALDLAYWTHSDKFSSLILNTPEFKNIKSQIEHKKNTYTNRNEIAEILSDQHNSDLFPEKQKLIQSLKEENTYTIMCAHQPLMLGGFLYWWYKIIHTIGLKNELKKLFPDYNFIAIYYCGTEDHDFDEISKINVFQKEFQWQSKSSGANGRKPIEGIKEVLEQISSLFQNNEFALSKLSEWNSFLAQNDCYNDFYQKFFYSIFGDHEILYFNPDNPKAKQLSISLFIKELKENLVKTKSSLSIQNLEQMGYESQAHVHELNLFYIMPDSRVLIQSKDDRYFTKDNSKVWSFEELINEINNRPENFSPNVVMRPLYQELLFPNIIFIGGGAEIAYWLQLKEVFNSSNITFPILWRRFSAIFVSNSLHEKILSLNLDLNLMLKPLDEIVKYYLKIHSNFGAEIQNSENKLRSELKSFYNLSDGVDKSTQNSIASDISKMNQAIDHIVNKLKKSEKNQHDISIKKIEKLKNTIFPNQVLQERSECGLQYYLQYGNSFLDNLIINYNSSFQAIYILEKNKTSE